LQIPPTGAQVAVAGAVKRPAIYELKNGETSLAGVIDDAGGFTSAASLAHITIERIDANLQRETVTLQSANRGGPRPDREAVNAFPVRDGDRIRVEPILPYSERAIYLEGHVVRPGHISYKDGSVSAMYCTAIVTCCLSPHPMARSCASFVFATAPSGSSAQVSNGCTGSCRILGVFGVAISTAFPLLFGKSRGSSLESAITRVIHP